MFLLCVRAQGPSIHFSSWGVVHSNRHFKAAHYNGLFHRVEGLVSEWKREDEEGHEVKDREFHGISWKPLGMHREFEGRFFVRV